MTAHETRQYEMLLRVRDFGRLHQDLFPDPGVARETFAALGGVIDGVAAADIAKRSASGSVRSDRKVAARKVLGDLLLKVSQTARVLRARGHSMPPFELSAARTDQDLLTAARQFARDATPVEAAFVAHGMVPSSVTEAATVFETAVRDRGMSRADHIAARTRIQELLTSALAHVRTLDVIVNNELARDKVIQTVWKRARRIDRRRPRGSGVAETPSSAADTEAQASSPAVRDEDVAA